MGFNIKDNKTIIGAIILIKNENQETFCSIFKYLNNKYNFQPSTINIDCNNAEIIAVKKVFINTKIILCYYHLMKRLVQHLPELSSKIKEIKFKAKNLLCNIRLLIFIKRECVYSFFDKIY